MNPVQYIIESCEHQNATEPRDFVGMTMAYGYAREQLWVYRPNSPYGDKLLMSDLAPLICYIHGGVNWVEFRCQPATFPNGGRTRVNSRSEILRQIQLLIDNQHSMTPEEFYFAFEDLHCWPDGNGRVGSILFNYLNGSLADPVHPPQNPEWGMK